ncbi:hypothetical protein [Williamsia serinedens]|uniref:hypothetical protein n=1 Tax=Williamsia serinedens TaxID=391736 RepID=UPI002FE7EC12
MARANLAAVPDGAKAPAKPKSVAEAAKSGTHRELLVAMRDRVATAVNNPECPPRDLASLTKRLADLAKEIEASDSRAMDDPTVYARKLEAALRSVAPDHELLVGVDEFDDRFDASAV